VRDVPQIVLDRCAANAPIITAEEVAVWPPGSLDRLMADGVLKATHNAMSVCCEACGLDHVERVEYIESPPDSELRAYIPCPVNGRVRVPLDKLRRWIVCKKMLPGGGAITGRSPETTKRQGKHHPAKRSWTQADLDDAIREFKAKRASTYNDLVSGVKQRKAGAEKSARALFGRNAIVRALGVRSVAMVSRSSVWQAIADELKLRVPNSGRLKKHGLSQRIGMEIALEDKAEATSQTGLDQAVRRETIQLIEKSMPANEAAATIGKLQRGGLTDDAARDLVEVFVEQKRDERTRKVRQLP
jgi:hypothetical protein